MKLEGQDRARPALRQQTTFLIEALSLWLRDSWLKAWPSFDFRRLTANSPNHSHSSSTYVISNQSLPTRTMESSGS
jgi:hypothetical protein